MAFSEELPSPRAFLVFVFLEAILAGILWMIGLLYPGLLVFLGLLGLAGLFLWDRGHKALVALCAMAALATIGVAGYAKWSAVPPPAPTPMVAQERAASIEDVVAQLVVDSVKGNDVVGHFLLTNGSPATLKLGTVTHQAPGKMLAYSSDGLPRTVRPGKRLEIPIDPENDLATISSVRLQFDYSLDGVKAEVPAFFQFDRPGGFDAGTYDPTGCCDQPDNLGNIIAQGTADIFQRGIGFKWEFDEARGRWAIKDDAARMMFVFDPVAREVILLRVRNRRAEILRAPLKRTADGRHTVEAFWRPSFTLKVDGEPGTPVKEGSKQ